MLSFKIEDIRFFGNYRKITIIKEAPDKIIFHSLVFQSRILFQTIPQIVFPYYLLTENSGEISYETIAKAEVYLKRKSVKNLK